MVLAYTNCLYLDGIKLKFLKFLKTDNYLEKTDARFINN